LARNLLDLQIIRFMCISADEITPHLSNDAWAQGYVMGLFDAIRQEAGFDQTESLTYIEYSVKRQAQSFFNRLNTYSPLKISSME